MEQDRARKPRSKPPGRTGPRHETCGKGEAIEDDAAIGAWPKEELERMDFAFRQAIARSAKDRS
jgi:hypothetical protein